MNTITLYKDSNRACTHATLLTYPTLDYTLHCTCRMLCLSWKGQSLTIYVLLCVLSYMVCRSLCGSCTYSVHE